MQRKYAAKRVARIFIRGGHDAVAPPQYGGLGGNFRKINVEIAHFP